MYVLKSIVRLRDKQILLNLPIHGRPQVFNTGLKRPKDFVVTNLSSGRVYTVEQ